MKKNEITLTDVKIIFEKANLDPEIVPSDIDIYKKAFIHRSYTAKQSKTKDRSDQNYETLEFYGDSIVSCATVEYLFNRYPTFDEGKLTKLKNFIVSSTYLADFSRYYGFSKFIMISESIEILFGRNTNNILEDVFEAFVASISIDCGFMTAKQFVTNTIDSLVNMSKLLCVNRNYKDRILNYFQVSGWKHPKYVITSEFGPQNKKTFSVELFINYKDNFTQRNVVKAVCRGVGKNKKNAEMNASYNALKYYGLLTDNDKLINKF